MITELLPIKYPIIQAGMVWVSGAKLAAASAEAGILGVIGAGSMKPDLLRAHIKKAKTLTSFPERLAVNVPLLYKLTQEQLDVSLEEGIRIFITSAGSPKKYTSWLKEKGCIVIHVISTPELAFKCQEAGCDAVIAEGFEAGGHNGRDEITTLCLIPQVLKRVHIPVIAAGGIATGQSWLAMMSLGAAGVQIGTRFVATRESSAHDNFKKLITESTFNSTMLMMKKLVPVRLYKNKFYDEVLKLEESGASSEKLEELLGHGRARAGMLEGDLNEGELEVGQIAGLIKDIPTVSELVEELVGDYNKALHSLKSF